MTGDLEVQDLLHGKIVIPSHFVPFLRMPEFVRLRGVRLSNLDSIQFKDFNGPTRWEHAIGVFHLATRCASARGLGPSESIELQLAALLHDIATPPFAHTAEYVLESFDHELETSRLLAGDASRDVAPNAAIYLSEAPRFKAECARIGRELGLRIDADRVAQLVIGAGELGFLMAGSVDLDNADNVLRASFHMGFAPRRELALELALYLATCDSAPTDLVAHPTAIVREWAELRRSMYSAFFNQGPIERGREAFLQHLFRKAVRLGVPRRQLVWNTDEGLLSMLESFQDSLGALPMRDAVKRYRLLEDPEPLITLPLFEEREFSALANPLAVSWIENRLTGDFFEAVVTVARNRFAGERQGAEPLGEVRVFKLGHGWSRAALPDWVRNKVPAGMSGKALMGAFRRVVSSSMSGWVQEKPWVGEALRDESSVRTSLESVGNWEFRLSRNSPLHTYPSTFVQELPSTLIHALGMSGELVLDPFGGTGNTAMAAVLAGGKGITSDSNQIATLISRVRGSYLDAQSVERIRSVELGELEGAEPSSAPELDYLEKWHHTDTMEQLCRIRTFCSSTTDPTLRDFFFLAFSSILTSCTARRGEEGSYFADNTPLRKGELGPPFVDAFELFLTRIRRNLNIQLSLYGRLEGSGGDAESRLQGFTAISVDALSGEASDYGVDPKTVPLILASPPYLSMTDYSLGHRLSYAWLGLDMKRDFALEVSPRRLRPRAPGVVGRRATEELRAAKAIDGYLESMGTFGRRAAALMHPDGLLALVQGEPTAKAFEGVSILPGVDSAIAESGLRLVWSTWRPISWARHHGFAALKSERIAVYRME